MKKILILIIIAMVFLISNSEAIVCCEQSNGNYCVEKNSESQCTGLDEGYKTWTGRNCAQVENCKKGCCAEGDEGSCFSDSEKVKCLKHNGKWFDKSCSSVALCAKGCCFIGTNTWFITQGQCLMKASQKGLSPVFETDAKDDSDCQVKLDEKLGIKTMGCCISEEGSCNYQEKGSCSNFVKGYCMDIKSCGCKSGFSCEGKRDVYEISSCGDERIVRKCDGVKKVCGLVRSNEDNAVFLEKGYYKWKIGLGEKNLPGAVGSVEGIDCVNIGCEVGKEFLHDGNLNLYENIDQIIKIDKTMLWGVDYRKNGESWCINPESKEAGTRYYKYRCSEGRIVSEGCSVTRYKEGICKENRENDFSEADCVDSVPDYWTRGKAMEGNIVSPPAFKFYDPSKSWSDGVSLSDSCGYCEASSNIWERLVGKGCKSSKCNNLGDCKFDTAGFSGKGCVYGALAAEVMWLTMGSIATIGSGEGLALGEGGIADPGAFANTGWQGFWDTGLFGDVGKKLAVKNAEKIIVEKGAAGVDQGVAEILLKDGEFISSTKAGSEGLYYKEAGTVYHIETERTVTNLVGGNLKDYKLGKIYSIPGKGIIRKTAEGVAYQKATGTLLDLVSGEEQPVEQPSVKSYDGSFEEPYEEYYEGLPDQILEDNNLGGKSEIPAWAIPPDRDPKLDIYDPDTARTFFKDNEGNAIGSYDSIENKFYSAGYLYEESKITEDYNTLLGIFEKIENDELYGIYGEKILVDKDGKSHLIDVNSFERDGKKVYNEFMKGGSYKEITKEEILDKVKSGEWAYEDNPAPKIRPMNK